MSCPHIAHLADTLHPPGPSQRVHRPVNLPPLVHQLIQIREECTLCFDGQDDLEGVLVCLQCFNGGCFGEGRRHAFLHFQKSQHPLGVVIKRTRKEQKKRDSSEPPAKKLAISAPTDEELYNYSTSVRCFACSPVGEVVHTEEANVARVVACIMSALSSAQRSEVKAWEEEILACEHTLTLQQESLIQPGHVPTQCSACDLTNNLWLCLTCGLANCGRQQFGGAGGNGHALQHYKETGHGVGVKLGTITPEGSGDVYCYICDDAKVDPGLATNLRTFGIDIMGQAKTEKSMTELQLEHNLKFDFSMTGDDGQELQPVFGPGLTGFRNLGNSCYMNSVMQTLFTSPSFRERYHSEAALSHAQSCDNPSPASCLECQMLKLADGLLSGRYSVKAKVPPPATSDFETPELPRFQEGIRPADFKALIGQGHEEFSTMRQQDSEEFLQHLLTRLRAESKRQGRNEALEATNILKFGFEQRLQCTECKRVGYKLEAVDLASLPVEAVQVDVDEDGKKKFEPVKLEESLEALCATEELGDYACASCGHRVKAEKSTRFKTFPDLLVLHMKKFQLVNWLPTKLDVPVLVPELLSLDRFAGKGRQAGEDELDLDAAPPAAGGGSAPEFDAAAMSQLESMGFPTVRCQKALLATGGSDAEAAMNWLFEHMDDPDIDAPIPAPASAGSSTIAGKEPSAEQIATISDMGFTPAQARKALRMSDGNPEQAIEYLFNNPDDQGEEAASASAPAAATAEPVSPEAGLGGSASLPANYRLKAFISHKGPSVHSGHYVTTIRQPQGHLSQKGGRAESEDEWVLFNDEKVARAPEGGGEEMRSLAYLYVYERV